MMNSKPLVTLIAGHETTVQGYAPATARFADSAGRGGETRKDQAQDRRNAVAALGGLFARRAAPSRQVSLTICRDFGPDTVGMVLRRSLASRSRILLCLSQLPPNLRSLHRFVLAGVDAVLVETDAMARVVLALGMPAHKIVSLCDPGDLSLFSRPPRVRGHNDAYRIIHVGDLEPEAGVAELLPCVVAWANRNPDRHVEILWSGEGCLRGVLEAQPLPANVVQHFPGRVPREELAAMFLECDLLAVPALSDTWTDPVSEAMAAQLPVLGSSRSRMVTEMVTHGVTGWVFDPFEAGAMTSAVDRAINALPHEIERMRSLAAERLRGPMPGLDERLRRAMGFDGSELPLDLRSLGLAL